MLLEQRNRFFEGDEADCLFPSERPHLLRLTELRDLDGNPIEVAPHPKMRLTAACARPVAAGPCFANGQKNKEKDGCLPAVLFSEKPDKVEYSKLSLHRVNSKGPVFGEIGLTLSKVRPILKLDSQTKFLRG